MMIADAPDELLDAAEKKIDLRLAIGDLAEVYRCAEAADVLKARFGPDWRSHYAKARRANARVISAP
jgi:hypothetical protein